LLDALIAYIFFNLTNYQWFYTFITAYTSK